MNKDSRREFIKKTMLLSGAAGLSGVLPPSIQRALAINPAPGSTYLDAEHIVVLMQENRSFDHCFGSLQGVRGFNDPRAFRLANGNPVWFQTDKEGKTFAPFRLNMKDTNATWMGSLPHSRMSQVDAYNKGQHDQWLKACLSKKYPEVPFTLGYHNREDLPFNYAMADAFTICDQHFCSVMSSTWPNRHYLWGGNLREELNNPESVAHVRNDLAFGEAKWRTFPEKMEEHNVSWKVYQNDLTAGGGMEGAERSWLTNFTCNPLEYYAQYNVKYSKRYVQGLKNQVAELPEEIKKLEQKASGLPAGDTGLSKLKKDLKKKQEVLKTAVEELKIYSPANYAQLPQRDKNLYEKAFSINDADPDYHTLEEIKYKDGDTERSMSLPKGDVLHTFRQDVRKGKLPAVSWIIPSQMLSDHPSAPWYGAWHVSEVLDILTENPEVWKKTIFILTYDENDGYFDHVPPFTPPHPYKAHAGKCSSGIDTAIEYVKLENEQAQGLGANARGGQIGLGYRVPMIVASPWSRGGRVNSQVFDHTSVLQFMEVFLSRKFGKPIKEDNISKWRRTVCGDLTSVFTTYKDTGKKEDYILKKMPFSEMIFNAKYKEEPTTHRALSEAENEEVKKGLALAAMPKQEKGTRPSCALPYQLYADGNLSADKKGFEIQFQAGKIVFGAKAAGSPFMVYAPVDFRSAEGEPERNRNWQYAVAAGDRLSDRWETSAFENQAYHLKVYGPNGFFREYRGNANDPLMSVNCDYERKKGVMNHLTGNLTLLLSNTGNTDQVIEIRDNAYQKGVLKNIQLKKGMKEYVVVNLDKSHGWYDVSVQAAGATKFEKRYAGRVETGNEGISDPVMGA
jgi:phospholipase C